MTIEEFERRLRAVATAVDVAARKAVERGAVMIEDEAKREIGHYQPAVGPLPRWPRLQPSTLREKTRLGYSPPANPLLRTGALKAGITHTVMDPMMSGGKIEARVGVNGIVAVVQEEGTQNGHVPAGSYLERAARRKEDAVRELIRREIGRALGMK